MDFITRIVGRFNLNNIFKELILFTDKYIKSIADTSEIP